jgi:hypothetical protein
MAAKGLHPILAAVPMSNGVSAVSNGYVLRNETALLDWQAEQSGSDEVVEYRRSKKGSPNEKKAAKLIWIGTVAFLTAVFAHAISDSRNASLKMTGDAAQPPGLNAIPTAPRSGN